MAESGGGEPGELGMDEVGPCLDNRRCICGGGRDCGAGQTCGEDRRVQRMISIHHMR